MHESLLKQICDVYQDRPEARLVIHTKDSKLELSGEILIKTIATYIGDVDEFYERCRIIQAELQQPPGQSLQS